MQYKHADIGKFYKIANQRRQGKKKEIKLYVFILKSWKTQQASDDGWIWAKFEIYEKNKCIFG